MVWWAQALCDPWSHWTCPHGLVGLKAVHVVGSPEAPGGEELEEVDLHRGFDKYDVVWGQAKAVGTHTEEALCTEQEHGTQCRASCYRDTGTLTSVPALALVAHYKQNQVLLPLLEVSSVGEDSFAKAAGLRWPACCLQQGARAQWICSQPAEPGRSYLCT